MHVRTERTNQSSLLKYSLHYKCTLNAKTRNVQSSCWKGIFVGGILTIRSQGKAHTSRLEPAGANTGKAHYH